MKVKLLLHPPLVKTLAHRLNRELLEPLYKQTGSDYASMKSLSKSKTASRTERTERSMCRVDLRLTGSPHEVTIGMIWLSGSSILRVRAAPQGRFALSQLPPRPHSSPMSVEPFDSVFNSPNVVFFTRARVAIVSGRLERY